MEGIALIAFTQAGCSLARRIAAGLAEVPACAGATCSVSGPARFADEFGIEAYESLGAWTARHFAESDALVFVGASGIAVRAIAPHVRDKFSDPAVVSVDEAGRFAVPLLSGHVGGANDLSRKVARITGGQAVVSTATDVNGLFAVDEWAARHGLVVLERPVAKEISARLLEGGEVGFASDFAIDWELPTGIARCVAEGVAEGVDAEVVAADALRGVPTDAAMPPGAEGAAPPVAAGAASPTAAGATSPVAAGAASPTGVAEGCGELGFVVSLDDRVRPFERTLHLVPRIATVGVGCRRGTDPAVLERAVDAALTQARVSRHGVEAIASIDVKADEPAILQLAQTRGWQARFYTAEELAAVAGEFASSAFVERTVGVGNVCERAACADGARLVAGRRSGEGVTVAIAVREPFSVRQRPTQQRQGACSVLGGEVV